LKLGENSNTSGLAVAKTYGRWVLVLEPKATGKQQLSTSGKGDEYRFRRNGSSIYGGLHVAILTRNKNIRFGLAML